MGRTQTLYATIPQSASVSVNMAMIGTHLVGLWAPVVTSCQVYLQGSYDTTSANYVPMDRTDGSTRWAWNVGAGSKMVGLVDEGLHAFYFRLETSITQANTVVFALSVRV